MRAPIQGFERNSYFGTWWDGYPSETPLDVRAAFSFWGQTRSRRFMS
jgi:hypothetical protein